MIIQSITDMDNYGTKKKIGHYGLLFSWLASYIFILLLAFLFTLSTFLLLSRNLKQESFRVHSATLKQSQISIDYLLTEIKSIISEVTLLPEIQSLGWYSGDLGSRQYYLKNLLRDELHALHRSHPAIESLFVYVREGDYIVSSLGAYEVDYYFETFYNQSELTVDQWKKLLFKKQYMGTISLIQSNHQGEFPQAYIQFITATLSIGEEPPRVSICLTVKESSIQMLISTYESEEGKMFILGKENHSFLIKENPIPPSLLKYEWLINQSDSFEVFDDMVFSCFPSALQDWLFISLYPKSTVEFRLHKTEKIVYLLIFLFWIGGGMAAYFFSVRNYQPVTKLMEFVSGNTGEREVTHFRREEYKYIEESFNRLKEEKASIQDQLTLQRETLRMNFLSRLLMGKLKETSHSLEEQCEYHSFYFEEEAFVTVLLQMEGTILSNAQLSQNRGAQWLSRRIQSVLSQYAGGNGWVCDINNESVLFLNIRPPVDDPPAALASLLEDLKERLLEETGITYTVGASSYKTKLSAIPLSFEEAQEALALRMVRGKGAVITYYDILEQEKERKIINSLNWERRFINVFTSGDYQEAGRLMQDGLSRLEHMPNLSILRIRLFGFINLLLDALGDFFDDSFIADLDCEKRLISCTTLEETRKEMSRLFQELQNYTLCRQETTSLKDRVTELIERNYPDPNLSVGYLADQMGLSISNFSWLFKEETGMGPLDCIHRIRLREAKAMLIKGRKRTVKEIAGACGYLSDITFIRVFKKYEGVTPGQFRNGK